MVLAENAMLEDNCTERDQLFKEACEKFESSIALHEEPRTLVLLSNSIVNQIIICSTQSPEKDKLLDRALSMSLKAESFESGAGSLTMARISALQGRTKVVQKCLKHAQATNNLPDPESLLHDLAFVNVKDFEWFQSFLNVPTPMEEC